MRMRILRAACVGLAALLGGGCGLLLDFDPPDPDAASQGLDAGARDGGGMDASGADAGRACEAAAECDDADPCNGAERCVGGACVAGEARDCGDGIDCTSDACDPSTGACVHTPESARCPDDGLACTVEVCSDARGCVAELRHGRCDDGVFCTIDACDPEAATSDGCRHDAVDERCGMARCDAEIGCVGTECEVEGDCVLGPCHTAATCAAGACVRTNAGDGVACDDANPCSAVSVCMAGECRGDGDPTCPGQPCVRCDPSGPGCDGSLVAAPGTSCADGNACTGPDACSGAICTGATISCDDGNACTADVCDASSGCGNVVTPGASCIDADLCTEATTCQPDGRCGLGRPSCPPSASPCVRVTCRPSDGACLTSNVDGVACEGGGVCAGGVCTMSTTCSAGRVRCPDGTCCPTLSGFCDGLGRCEVCNPDEFACPCEGICVTRSCAGAPGCCDGCSPSTCDIAGTPCDSATQLCCECAGTCYDRTCTGPGCCPCAI